VPYHLLQQSLRDLDRAYKNFFSKHAQFPQFHKKGRQDSFRFPDPKQIKVENNKRKGVIKLPKIGKVEFICSRENAFSGRLRNVTVVRDAGHWYVCLNCELEHEIPVNNGKSVGIDRGIAKSLVLSNGKQYDLPEARIKEIEAKIAYTQRRLTKKVKFSSNWKKVKVKVTNLHSRLARIRKDFLHKATTEIAKNHGVVVLEDLKVKNMSKSAKGTIEEPGKNVKAKSGLNRSILRQGWGMVDVLLAYKTQWYGSRLEYVAPQKTSQTCSACGYIDAKSRISQSVFCCTSCGNTANADMNASENILAKFTLGLRGSACRGTSNSLAVEAGIIGL
jgi:putative transposase